MMAALRLVAGLVVVAALAYFASRAIARFDPPRFCLAKTSVGALRDAGGAVKRVARDGDYLDLTSGESFTIVAPRGKIDRIRVSLSPFTDLERFTLLWVDPADPGTTTALHLHPRESWRGELVRRAPGQEDVVLASTSSASPPAAEDGIAIECALSGGKLEVRVDGATRLRGEFDREDLSGAKLDVAGKARLRDIQLRGAEQRGVSSDWTPFELRESFSELPPQADDRAPLLAGLLAACCALLVALAAAFTRRGRFDRALLRTALALVPVAALLAWLGSAPRGVTAPLVLLAAAAAGLVAARRGRAKKSRVGPGSLPDPPVSPWRSPGAIVGVVGLLAVIGSPFLPMPGGDSAAVEPAEGATAVTADRSAPYDGREVTPLHAGNALWIEGPWRDYELKMQLATGWGGVLETRLHAPREVADGTKSGHGGISFLLGTDPRVRTGFARTDGAVVPFGSDAYAMLPQRLLEVTVQVRGGVHRAFVVDRFDDEAKQALQAVTPIAEARSPASSGDVVLATVKGEIRVDWITVTPLSSKGETAVDVDDAGEIPEAHDPGRRRHAFALAACLLLLAVAVVAAGGFHARSLLSAALGLAPVALMLLATSQRAPRGHVEELLACAPVAFGLAFTAMLPAHGATRSRLLALAAAAFAFVFFSLGGATDVASLRDGTTCDWFGRRFEPDLAMLRHARFRRGCDYLLDHRLHGRECEPRRDGDPLRVLVLGDQDAIANDATATHGGEFAARVEQGLNPRGFPRHVEVFDGTWRGATIESVLALLEQCVLAPAAIPEGLDSPDPGVSPPRIPGRPFAPDLVLIVAHPDSALPGPGDALAAASRSGYFRTRLAELDEECALVAGVLRRPRFDSIVESFLRVHEVTSRVGCKIVLLIAPRDGVTAAEPPVLSPDGTVDVFVPSLPALREGGVPYFHDARMLARRGRLAVAEQVAQFLRRRWLATRREG